MKKLFVLKSLLGVVLIFLSITCKFNVCAENDIAPSNKLESIHLANILVGLQSLKKNNLNDVRRFAMINKSAQAATEIIEALDLPCYEKLNKLELERILKVYSGIKTIKINLDQFKTLNSEIIQLLKDHNIINIEIKDLFHNDNKTYPNSYHQNCLLSKGINLIFKEIYQCEINPEDSIDVHLAPIFDAMGNPKAKIAKFNVTYYYMGNSPLLDEIKQSFNNIKVIRIQNIVEVAHGLQKVLKQQKAVCFFLITYCIS